MRKPSALKTMGVAVLSAVAAIGACAGLVLGGVVDVGGATKTTTAPAAGTPVVQRSSTSGISGDSLTSLYRSFKGGVVFVQATTQAATDPFGEQSGGQTASGSGFVYDKQGHIITNEHVVDGASSVSVRIGENGRLIPAQVVGADTSTDIAVLKVDPGQAGSLQPLQTGSSSSAQVGQSVIAIGSPFGLQGTLTSGIVSALNRQIQSPGGTAISGALQTDAAINPGNSGGPLLDEDGRVIGINAQIASESGSSSGVGFAIPIDTIKQIVPRIESGALGQQQQPQQQQDPAGEGSPSVSVSPDGTQLELVP
jgi:S1-C subfamily serine protease